MRSGALLKLPRKVRIESGCDWPNVCKTLSYFSIVNMVSSDFGGFNRGSFREIDSNEGNLPFSDPDIPNSAKAFKRLLVSLSDNDLSS